MSSSVAACSRFQSVPTILPPDDLHLDVSKRDQIVARTHWQGIHKCVGRVVVSFIVKQVMEVNKEEAIRCLHIAQRHRGAANLSSALRFAKKSVALFPTPEGEAMISVVQTEIEAAGEGASSSSGSTPTTAKSTGVEEHITSARDRKRAPAAEKEKENVSEKKTYTAKHVEVVKRVKRCRHHEYYEILSSVSLAGALLTASRTDMYRE